MKAIEILKKWYHINCNGDWEHQYGVKIETLDNLGWCLKIDLEQTPLDKKTFSKEFYQNELSWYRIGIDENSFVGFGSCLEKLAVIFYEDFLLPNLKNNDFIFDLYEEFSYQNITVWKRLEATMIDLDTFIIIQIPDFRVSELVVQYKEDWDNIDYKEMKSDNFISIHNKGEKIGYELKPVYQGVILKATTL